MELQLLRLPTAFVPRIPIKLMWGHHVYQMFGRELGGASVVLAKGVNVLTATDDCGGSAQVSVDSNGGSGPLTVINCRPRLCANTGGGENKTCGLYVDFQFHCLNDAKSPYTWSEVVTCGTRCQLSCIAIGPFPALTNNSVGGKFSVPDNSFMMCAGDVLKTCSCSCTQTWTLVGADGVCVASNSTVRSKQYTYSVDSQTSQGSISGNYLTGQLNVTCTKP
jgi:hypothetical protein